MSKELLWSCRIGAASSIPPYADQPMRDAIRKAYTELTGEEPDFIYSGWGEPLTEEEKTKIKE